MSLGFSSDAMKQLKKLPKADRNKVWRKIEVLEHDPYLGKKLEGQFAEFRSIQAWPYRIIYSFSVKEGLVIEAVKHRQGAYK